VRNVHFEEQVAAGEMTFDYVLRPGIVQSSNALLLMREVGIDVPLAEHVGTKVQET
jgi:DNA mismatch repair ATPase MutS